MIHMGPTPAKATMHAAHVSISTLAPGVSTPYHQACTEIETHAPEGSSPVLLERFPLQGSVSGIALLWIAAYLERLSSIDDRGMTGAAEQGSSNLQSPSSGSLEQIYI
jgi:hypothetical protein